MTVESRRQDIEAAFCENFKASFMELYDLCVDGSSCLNEAGELIRTLTAAAAAYWTFQDIASVTTPYGSLHCNPLPCIVFLACAKAKSDHECAIESRRLVNFFNGRSDCEDLATKVAKRLFERFEFALVLLVNGPSGVKQLADFFVDAIADGLRKVSTVRDLSEEMNISTLVEMALPPAGAEMYRRHCRLKRVELQHKQYQLAVPGQEDEFKMMKKGSFTIEGLITASPGYLSVGEDKALFIKEGTNGENIYPPQLLRDTKCFTHHDHFTFSEISYRSQAVAQEVNGLAQSTRQFACPLLTFVLSRRGADDTQRQLVPVNR